MSTTSPTAAADPTRNPYRWAMLGGLWLIYFSFGLTVAGLAPLVGPITADLGLSHTAMGSVMGAWPLVYIGAAIPCGALLDRIGPRRALMLGALVIAASGAMRGLSTGHASLFVAVALFGLGGPLVSVGAPKLISLWFAGKDRGLAMGVYITGPTLGGVAALSLTNSVTLPLMGGDWRLVLMSYGALALFAGLVWTAITTHGASRAVEAKIAAEPQRPPFRVFAELLGLPAVRLVLAMGVATLFINHSLNNWLPRILHGHGMDDATAGYWASIPLLVGVCVAPIVPRLAVPSRRYAVLLGLFLSLGTATLLIQVSGGPLLVFGLACQGVTRGAIVSVLVLVLMEAPGIGPRHIGAAGGLYFSAAEVGGVLGPLTMGTVHDLTGGFSTGLYLLTGVAVLLIVLLARLRALPHEAARPMTEADGA